MTQDILVPTEIEINGVRFKPRDDCRYYHPYCRIMRRIEVGDYKERDTFRQLCQEDLWFILYFVLKYKDANHPFVVDACRDVQDGPRSDTLDLWAREHYKSSIITVCESMQRVFNNPEERVLILSYAKKPALKFLNQIKQALESSAFLKWCFPDILYENPQSEAYRWSEDGGLFVRRESTSKEPTFDAGGLIEGQPTGSHATHRVYDDIVTFDLVNTPEMMTKVKEAFDMSENLGAEGGTCRIVGTIYHHEDPLVYIKGKKDQEGNPLFITRIKTATDDGTPNGKSVLMSDKRLAKLRTNVRHFYCQQLLDPTPQGTQKLNREFLVEVHPKLVPNKCIKFMTIDPAGDVEGKDAWALIVAAIERYRDDIGASRLFIIDAVIEPMDLQRAVQTAVDMYCRNGKIAALGVEKTGMTTTEVHICNALRSRGRYLTIDNGGLVILRPAGRSKVQRIEQSLVWPLNNGKIHISKGVPPAYRDRLGMEMDRFPYWKDDGLDALAFHYDLLKEYRFSEFMPEAENEEADEYDKFRDELERLGDDSWMRV